MKKGVLISGIITIVAYAITALVFFIVGMVYVATKGMVDGDPGAIPAEELMVVAYVFLSIAGYFVLSIVFSAIMIGTRNSGMGKGPGIASVSSASSSERSSPASSSSSIPRPPVSNPILD